MKAPENRLKRALAAEEMQIGLWLNLASPSATELVGGTGYDWALIDGEHAPFDPTMIQTQLRVLGQFDLSPIVRVPVGEDWVIKQVMDLGAQSLLVPLVDTGAQAERIVAATRYAPEGRRGMGAGVARAARFGQMDEYLTNANDEVCLIVQAETRLAVENIDEIANTDGVDCVFIGPADLSADMGHRGNPGHPEVKSAIAHSVARIRAAGKAAGILHYDHADFRYYTDLGVTFLGVGSEATLLRAALADNLRAARKETLV
ncbi:2,4-dihydroxyhept-2-ene-1,7-dioic acid aldolase [Aliiroseovarius zhejiangensis]|uniref:2,4-dihydroxyhept-2-ene-1,7-dioic acid aldolase n=1 Tax=Aliiroseovarius zhejiangensis TaxID=1632025 RepID=A0ABQ3IJU2_9RHOB|nr:HpcH/HpaI aldolase/citrate lyase family protein [Aliiroseovarius zhejiangensis]GHE85797.1 2,4-dihydroxyhept-2-ene-1,7-dioic acid aldolase [Aliiroseovarius zhejiangensis]